MNGVISDAASLDSTLHEIFGFTQFREGQREVVEVILSGQSALAVFPTGSGKSLCYQLSALHLEGVTVVVSPLIALMKDQLDFLKSRNVSAVRLDSSVSTEEFKETNARLERGEIKLLYVAPERFSNERFLQRLRRLKVAQLVIDEAHCISEWGHNFRPDYLKLAGIARDLGITRVMALTATATPAVAADVCREFGIAPEGFIHTGFYRPNLELRVCPSANDRAGQLVERLKQRTPGATIVYVTLQRTAQGLAAALVAKGLKARAYHAGLETLERTQTQDWFMGSQNAIVVATIAFGMGIDKANIRYVYHFNLPKSLENYSQEIGRAGRDGLPAVCEILACAGDLTVLENFTYGDTPDPDAVQGLVEWLVAHEDRFDISTYTLSRTHDVRPLVLNTLLTYLELADVLESTGAFYNEYQFVPLRSSREILARFDPERAGFLRQVFASAKQALKWFHIDLESTAKRLDCSRERLVKALTYLEEHGDLELKVAGLRQGFRIKTRPEDPVALSRQLMERFELRERKDIARVQQVADFVRQRKCLVRSLLDHFGEDHGRDCGHCGICLGESPTGLEREVGHHQFQAHRSAIARVREQHPNALGTPRRVTRFLCGLSSPLLVQSKLGKHPLFGVFMEIPFASVLEAVGGVDG